jgi:HEAT repeat protein
MRKLLLGAVLAGLSGGCAKVQPTLAGGKPVSHWVQALRSPDQKLRREAVLKLGNVGPADPAAFPGVMGALRDPNAKVRREAILALIKFGPAAKEALPALGELQHDRDTQVRTYATKALERLGGTLQ